MLEKMAVDSHSQASLGQSWYNDHFPKISSM